MQVIGKYWNPDATDSDIEVLDLAEMARTLRSGKERGVRLLPFGAGDLNNTLRRSHDSPAGYVAEMTINTSSDLVGPNRKQTNLGELVTKSSKVPTSRDVTCTRNP
jgi:hypothetical protein